MEAAVVSTNAERRAVIILVAASAPMAIPVGFAVVGLPPGFLRNLGFFAGPGGTPVAWLLAVCIAIAFVMHARRIPVVRHWLLRFSWLKALCILVAAIAATVEEAFFRRLIMDELQQAGASILLQVSASAVAFGLPHAWFGLLRPSVAVIRAAVVATTALGTGLAIVYVLGGRSLAPCITAHFLITAAVEPGLVLLAAGGGNQQRRTARMTARS